VPMAHELNGAAELADLSTPELAYLPYQDQF
jgi:hypothetical protein